MSIRSYSQYKRFGECPHRWSLEQKYEPKRRALALDEGTAFHLVLGKFYGARSLEAGLDVLRTYFGEIVPRDEEDADRLKTKENALSSVCQAYWNLVAVRDFEEFDFESIEKPFKFDLGQGDEIRGYIDGVWRHKRTGVRFIAEHKYQDDLHDELMPLDLQVSLYTLGLIPEFGLLPTIYNVCRKPAYKMTEKDGTSEGYRERVRKLVSLGSEKLLYTSIQGFESRFLVRRVYSRGARDLQAALDQVKGQSRLMREIEQDPSLAWRNVGDQCLYWCPMRDICLFQDPIVVDEFFTVKRRGDAKPSGRPGPARPVKI